MEFPTIVMKHLPERHHGLKLIFGLGLVNLAVCMCFANCGLLDNPVGDSRILNEFASGPLGSLPKELGKAYGRHSSLKPESEWNALGLWKKIQSVPPTYIPEGFSNRAPKNGPQGQWFVDARDGKRLFAPSSFHRGYSRSIWESEARKITANLPVQ